jgi:hypothetical protein
VTFWTRIADEDAYFELCFSPNVRLVPTVRRFVAEFYREAVENRDATSRLTVATHELLENAVRYASDGNTLIRIAVQREQGGVRVTIDTRNRASSNSIDSVRTALDELAAAADADAHYQVLMRRSAKRADGSGLGLGRVRAESGMQISYEVDRDAVHVRAQAQFAASAQGAKPS